MRIGINGGGISGLTFMNYLQQKGVNVTLFEKKDAFEENGSGILMGINAMKILQDLELDKAVIKKGQVIESMSQVYYDGTLLTKVDTAKMHKDTEQYTVCISRSDLHAVLAKHITSGRIRMNTEAVGTRQADGQIEISLVDSKNQKEIKSEKFDFLIGADGIFSKTRESFYGPTALRYSGYTCFRFIVEAPKELDQTKAFEFLGLGKRLGVFPQGQNKIYCFATLNATMGDETYRNISKENFAHLFKEFPAAAQGCLDNLIGDDSSVLIQRDIADLKKSILHVPKTGIIFCGDAGHATTPNLGQGAAMGMEDAYVFAKNWQPSIAPGDMAEQFNTRRKKRVEFIRSQSRFFGKIGQIENSVAAAIRNKFLKLAPQSFVQKNMQSLLLHSSVF